MQNNNTKLNQNPKETETENPEIYDYLDIIRDIEEQNDKAEKREYVAIIEALNVALQTRHFFVAGVIHARNDSIARLLAKQYCYNKIADCLANAECSPYFVIPTEIALKPVIIMRTKKQNENGEFYMVRLNIDGYEFTDNGANFPGSQPIEKMALLEAIMKYHRILYYI